MATLYEALCLDAFPNDGAVASAMTARGGKPLSAAELRIYLHDDPGRGWQLADGAGQFIVTVEAPPYHACSVRRLTATGFAEWAPYRVVADRYEAKVSGFMAFPPTDIPVGTILSRATGEQRMTADGGAEALMVFSNTAIAPEDRRHSGVEIRFVHQFADPRGN